MKFSNIWPILLSIVLPAFLIGCENIDSFESDDADLDARAKAVATICDFGSAEITVGTAYSVFVQNKDLKTGKPYLVEVALGGKVQSPSGQIKTNGTMLVSVQPWAAGAGNLSAYETKTKKNVVQKILKAQCAFVVKEKPSEDQCPYDPNKIVPGLCGCGVPEGTCGQDADGCREGVIDHSRGGADDRAACSKPYPWPSGKVDSYKDWCSLCAASTSVPYNPFDNNDDNAWTHYATRNIGSPVTTCANALLGAKSFLRTSQECSDFRATYGGVCCGREPACSYVAVWYKDSPDLSCDGAPATGRCRCADDLTAPGKPGSALSFPESDFSAISPFAQAVRNGDLCGVKIGKNQFQTGQYETTCARLYEAARRGFTQKYECGLMIKMLRDKCGSLPIAP